MNFYVEDILDEFTRIVMEADESQVKDPQEGQAPAEGESEQKDPPAQKKANPEPVTFEVPPESAISAVCSTLQSLGSGSLQGKTKRSLIKNIYTYLQTSVSNKRGRNIATTELKFKDITINLLPGATRTVEVEGSDGNRYRKYAKYNKDMHTFDICLLHIMGAMKAGAVQQFIDFSALPDEPSQMVKAIAKFCANIAGEPVFQEYLRYERPRTKGVPPESDDPGKEETPRQETPTGTDPQPEPAPAPEPEPQKEPGSDTLEADKVIEWATTASYIGSMAVTARPDNDSKPPVENMVDIYYPKMLKDYCEAHPDINPAIDTETDMQKIDDASQVKEWLSKIFGINNDLTKEQCVPGEEERGQIILDILNGKDKEPNPGTGNEPPGGPDNGNQSPTLNIIDWFMQPEILGKVAMLRKRLGNPLTAERHVFKENVSPAFHLNRIQFMKKVEAPLYDAYRSAANITDPVDTRNRELLRRLLVGQVSSLKKYNLVYNAYDALSAMTYDELVSNPTERGTNLRQRMLGIMPPEKATPGKDKNKDKNKNTGKDKNKDGEGLISKALNWYDRMADVLGDWNTTSNTRDSGYSSRK